MYRAGRGRRGTFTPSLSERRPEPKLPAPSGLQVFSISLDELLETEDADGSGITGARVVASYNWLDEAQSIIATPGGPPMWSPPKAVRRLPEDLPEYLRDVNAARSPEYPLEPAIRAITKSTAAGDLVVPDLFSCSHILSKLWDSLQGSGSNREFRFLVHHDGSTAFFIRRETTPDQKMHDVRGYGHTFLDSYLTWSHDLRKSDNNTQIIEYNLAGIDLLVRTGCNGYVKEGQPQTTSPEHRDDLDFNLDRAISSIALRRKVPQPSNELVVIEKGNMVDLDSILDVKTRSKRSKDLNLVDQEMARLWLSQISNLVSAFHTGGLFEKEDVEIHHVKNDWPTWEKNNSGRIASFALLLRKIMHYAETWPHATAMEVRSHGNGELSIYKQTEFPQTAMSPSTTRAWDTLVVGGSV